MTGVIFAETLRRSWKTALWWGLAIGSLAFMQVAIIQDVTLIQQTASIMESLPPFVLQMFGSSGDLAFLATPDGYLALRFFGFVLLVFAFYSVIAGMNVTANDEEAGILDSFLSLPAARWKLIIEKVLAYVLLTILVLLMTLVCLLAGIALAPAIEYNVPNIILATLNLLPSMLVVLTFTVFAAALFRRKSAVIAVSAAFVVGSYFLNVFASAASGTIFSQLDLLSFFHYYNSADIMMNGLSVVNVSILVITSVILIVLAIWRFQRRDVGV
jgi:ABC-type transport system involved in multi-copper enzyme maturation permease subunit